MKEREFTHQNHVVKISNRMWNNHSNKGVALLVNVYGFCLFKINLKINLKIHL